LIPSKYKENQNTNRTKENSSSPNNRIHRSHLSFGLVNNSNHTSKQ
jgi:hypothetical protein